METLPMMPEKMQLVVIRQTAKQYGLVKSSCSAKDVKSDYHCDRCRKRRRVGSTLDPGKIRMQKADQTSVDLLSHRDKAIREGFVNLRDGRAYNNLYHTAKARAEADWLVGINATRAMTCKYNAQLSCGRVQTPTLAMVAHREKEIRSFVPEGILWHADFIRRRAFHLERCKSPGYCITQKQRMDEIEKK